MLIVRVVQDALGFFSVCMIGDKRRNSTFQDASFSLLLLRFFKCVDDIHAVFLDVLR